MDNMIAKMYSEKSVFFNRLSVIYLFVVLFLAINLTACGNGQNMELDEDNSESIPVVLNDGDESSDAYPATASMADTDQEAYPAPVDTSIEAYPIQESVVDSNNVEEINGIDAYPVPEPVYATDGVRFSFDPVGVSSNEVTGTAPPDLLLAIVDITYAGTILGEGRSDADGRFSIPVSGLIDGHRIGISLMNIPPGETLASMVEQSFPYRGENYQMVPNIGTFLETTLIEP